MKVQKKCMVMFACLVGMVLSGCSSGGSGVSLIKNGTMVGYEQTTIGKAFEASFDNPKWEYFESDKGKKIVQFSGTISDKLHNAATAEIVTLRKQNPDDYQILIQLFNMAFQKILGRSYTPFSDGADNQFFTSLNKQFGCSGISWPGGNYAYPDCSDDKVALQYVNKTIDEFLNMAWGVGDPVTVQWAINVDGKTFQLQALESKSWEGIEAQNIIKE